MFKKLLIASTTILLAAAAAVADVRDNRTIERRLEIPGSTAGLVVDNVFGSIRVTTHGSHSIEFVAVERIEADSQRDLERARREVSLNVAQRGHEVVLYVDGPFRDCRNHCNWDPDYLVHYDLDIRVPAETDIDLKTVNEGEIEVTGVRGSFHVSNVNGGVELTAISGSGDASTVNGPLRVVFDENPDADSHFSTVNGELDFVFQPDLAADMRFKTFNGEVWTDFVSEPLPPTASPARDRQGSLGSAHRRLAPCARRERRAATLFRNSQRRHPDSQRSALILEGAS